MMKPFVTAAGAAVKDAAMKTGLISRAHHGVLTSPFPLTVLQTDIQSDLLSLEETKLSRQYRATPTTPDLQIHWIYVHLGKSLPEIKLGR